MNPANDNSEIEEEMIAAAKAVMDEPIRGSELKDILPLIVLPKCITLNEFAHGFEDKPE